MAVDRGGITIPGAVGRNQLAFDSVNSVYLAIVSSGPVTGRFLTAAGVAVGADFVIAPEGDFTGFTSIAFGDATAPVFLVTYAVTIGANTVKWGRIVSYDAGLPDISTPSSIMDITGSVTYSEKAQNVWNGARFLVGTMAGAIPYVQTFDVAGTVSAATSLGDGLDDYGAPALAFAPGHNVAIAVGFKAGLPSFTGGSYARIFNATTLVPITSMLILDEGRVNEDQQVVYQSHLGQFLTAWLRGEDGDFYVDTRLVAINGTLGILDLGRGFAGPAAGGVMIEYNAATETTLAASVMGSEGSLYAFELGDTGYPLDPLVPVLITAWDGVTPVFNTCIAADVELEQWLVTTTLNSGTPGRFIGPAGGGSVGLPTEDLDVTPVWEGYGGGGHYPDIRTLEREDTFEIAAAAEEEITLTLQVHPDQDYGRLVHPILGAFDYEVKPDEWVNLDSTGIVIPPLWASTRTLTNTMNTLWSGFLKDAVVEERWKSLGGLSMPITQLRMLLALWTMPVDPDVAYVQWFPSYANPNGWKVLLLDLQVGGQGVTLDDVVNYKDENGDPVGWVTSPVTLQLKIVEAL